MPQISIEQAIEDIRNGKMVILVDDEDRENEGDLTMAAEKVTPESINFMAKYGRGLICLPLTGDKCDQLNLPMMVKNNTSRFETGFTVSIEAKRGVTTGISAADRATTILTAVADDAKPTDLNRPGHIFPLRARDGGVMVRVGQTEGSVDLVRLSGLKPAGVICEIMDNDGTMSRMPALEKFSQDHGIGICTVADLVAYRMQTESFVHRAVEATIPTRYGGDFKMIAFENDLDGVTHIALVKGEINALEPTMVRVHSECMTGDLFGSVSCDCCDQLHKAMEMISTKGTGVILYLHHEGGRVGLIDKLRAYASQGCEGIAMVADDINVGDTDNIRDYGIGAQILVKIGVGQIRLLTNHPKNMVGLQGYGLEIVEQIPIAI